MHSFGTSGTPSVSVFGETTPLLWEPRGEFPRAAPVLVCHDEVVVECDAEQAADAKAWLEGVMFEGMDTVLNGMEEVHIPVEVGGRIARSWGAGG
jgi:hypothetical protein